MFIENPKIVFSNFRGRGKQYNPPGDRNFAIVLDEETEKVVRRLGYTVRSIPAGLNDEHKERANFIMVHLPSRFAFENPLWYGQIDKGEKIITKVGLAGMSWKVAGREGVKLYLVHIEFAEEN